MLVDSNERTQGPVTGLSRRGVTYCSKPAGPDVPGSFRGVLFRASDFEQVQRPRVLPLYTLQLCPIFSLSVSRARVPGVYSTPHTHEENPVEPEWSTLTVASTASTLSLKKKKILLAA